jgi:hypothetical protein
MDKSEAKIELLSATTGMFFVLWLVEGTSSAPVSTAKSLIAAVVGLVAGYLVAKSGLLDG